MRIELSQPRKSLALIAGASAALLLSACDHGDPARQAAQYGNAPQLPAPKNYLLPPMKVAPAGAWKQGEAPQVIAPLKISALAIGLQHPRFVYPLPNGDILIVESNGPAEPVSRPKDVIMGIVQGFGGSKAKGGNRITLVRPGANGRPAQQMVFLDHLNSPFGVTLVGNDLYVANTDALMRYTYHEGDTRITDAGTKLADLPGGPIDHHWTKSLLAGPDGSKLYVGVGSNSNITENGIGAEMNRADILEVDRASGAVRVFASGLRNPNSMQWEPRSKAMWTVVNERDEIGPDLVPDYLTSVKEGAFYGWPYSYYGHHVDERVKPQRPDLVAKAIPPDYALGSHVAPLGLVFNNAGSGAMPASLGEGAFVGEHGSWDRSPPSGYKVVFVPFHDGMPAGKPIDVVTGFLTDGKAKGRPVGLALDRSGALLIADDVGNTVWRVSAAGAGAQQVAQSANGTAHQ
jgi:glucose/arabinose dehydrogenase